MTHVTTNARPEDPRISAYDPPCPEAGFAHPAAYDALVHAWDLLRWLLTRFWTPVELASLPAIIQSRLLECLDWLRPIEQMLRRLIYIEALALAPGLPEPKPSKPRPAKPRPPVAFLDRPCCEPGSTGAWPVRFAGFRPARPGRPGRPPPPPESDFVEKLAPRDHTRMLSPWPLAFRLEAAIRVAVDPLPWIKRLAARLRRGRAVDLMRLGRPQRIRRPRTVATLNALADILNLPRCRLVDTS